MKKFSSLSKPYLFDSQLKYRLGLIKKRLESYPLDSMNFVMMDLERPDLRTRHAHWCSYDLTGRTLWFYSLADGIDGEKIERLPELFDRIMNNKRASGLFGKVVEGKNGNTDESFFINTQFLSGLVSYYELTGDMRALNAAKGIADNFLSKIDAFVERYGNPGGFNYMECWMTEGLAELYKVTKDEKYLDVIKTLTYKCLGLLEGSHSHGYITTLRGILKAGIYSCDDELITVVKNRRDEIINRGCIFPNGDISESLPRSHRNEGCSIADWITLNLLLGYVYNDDAYYETAEHSIWNALYFNQFVTGGFGHRNFSDNGYKTYIEEAWWCCSQNAGMCLTEIARHTVTINNGDLKLNFLIPGVYTVNTPEGDITITVTTGYPTKVSSIIKVSGTKNDIDIRVPYFIKDFSSVRYETPLGYELHINGTMGHYTENRGEGVVLKYGPLLLAPMIYNWEENSIQTVDTTVPEGYIHESIGDNNYSISVGNEDKNGFLNLEHDPLPDWSVYEEGEMAGISSGEVASCHVSLKASDGSVKNLYFQPLCSSTTNLTLMDIPIVFKKD